MNRVTITVKDVNGKFITSFNASELLVSSVSVGDYFSLSESEGVPSPQEIHGVVKSVEHQFMINPYATHHIVIIYVKERDE